MKKWLIFALVAVLCIAMVGCGVKDKEEKNSTSTEATGLAGPTAPKPTAPEPKPDLKVSDCYTYTEHKDGTYSYEVTWRGGDILRTETRMDRPVSFTELTEDVLAIHGQAGTGVGARWAMFCDIQRGEVSDTYGGYLAAVDNRVAFVDSRTDAYHVFVCDPFVPNEYTQVVTLEGLVVSGDVITDFSLNEEGILSVTYPTDSGENTITVDLKKE